MEGAWAGADIEFWALLDVVLLPQLTMFATKQTSSNLRNLSRNGLAKIELYEFLFILEGKKIKKNVFFLLAEGDLFSDHIIWINDDGGDAHKNHVMFEF